MADYPHDLRRYRHSDLQGRTTGDDHPQYARRTNSVITGGLTVTGGITTDCPVVITGNCTNALQVNSGTGQDFKVDTVSHFVQIGRSALTGSLTIGADNAGGAYSGFGFMMNHLGHFGVLEAATNAVSLFIDGSTSQIIFGDLSTYPTLPSILSTPWHTSFRSTVAFRDAFSWRFETTNTTALIPRYATTLHYNGAGGDVLTLPVTDTTLAGGGAKPGTIIGIKDAVFPGGLTVGNKCTIAPQPGDLIDGSATPLDLHSGFSYILQTDGVNWFTMLS